MDADTSVEPGGFEDPDVLACKETIRHSETSCLNMLIPFAFLRFQMLRQTYTLLLHRFTLNFHLLEHPQKLSKLLKSMPIIHLQRKRDRHQIKHILLLPFTVHRQILKHFMFLTQQIMVRQMVHQLLNTKRVDSLKPKTSAQWLPPEIEQFIVL